MTLPFEYQNASLDFERFMVDARDYAGLATTNMAWNMVVGVLHTFRRRLTIKQVIQFSLVLPPVIRSLFLEQWNPDQEVTGFGTEEQLLAEVRSIRPEHNFSPQNAISAVADALRNRVDRVEFTRVLAELPPEASKFWSPHGVA
ncbi:MAG: DUF2267 domain-containing protein [Hydrogenophaga sp.]|jgi:uncharacterized protein (DUF2267 family)|nr:DUF2267 domain-containing protein [Hydrogenophaga sp.]MDZ4359029.1 DUF2267 domain-containing protein [Variovorax sp.]